MLETLAGLTRDNFLW